MKYVYPAIFTEEESGGYSVDFPDIEGCYTQGETLQEAIENAEDVLCLALYDCEENDIITSPPSEIRSLSLEKNQLSTLISCDTIEYRIFMIS